MRHPKYYDTTSDISKRMSHVRLKKGKAETLLAKALWHRGYHYRLNYRRLPGSPDIAITKHKLAIFIDGEFWHGYDWQRKKGKLKANRQYWLEKIEENIARDERNNKQLAAIGWTVLRFWEKDIKKDLEGCIQTVETVIFENMLQQQGSTIDFSELD